AGIEIARIRHVRFAVNSPVEKSGPRESHTKRRVFAIQDSIELLLIVRKARRCQEPCKSIGRVIAVVIAGPCMVLGKTPVKTLDEQIVDSRMKGVQFLYLDRGKRIQIHEQILRMYRVDDTP